MDLESGPVGRHVVVVDGVALRNPPQLVPVVVLVHRQDLPAVLVDVEGAPLVDVTSTLPERRVDHPDSVQFVPRQVGIDV